MQNNHEACPVKHTLELIGNKWRIFILQELFQGTRRFSQLQKSLGNVTQKVLTANLRALEANGLITRTVYAEVPPRVEYSLSSTGQTLKPILACMAFWGDNYKSDGFCTECMAAWSRSQINDFFKTGESA